MSIYLFNLNNLWHKGKHQYLLALMNNIKRRLTCISNI